MESTRNLTGRLSDSDSRIQLREGLWDSVGYPVRKVAVKIILSKRSGGLRSRGMKIIVKSTDSAKSASGVGSSFQKFRFQRFLFTQIPPFPRLWSGYQIFQRPSLQKQIPRNTTPARPSGCSKMERTASSANTIPKGCCWRRGMRWTMPTNKES